VPNNIISMLVCYREVAISRDEIPLNIPTTGRAAIAHDNRHRRRRRARQPYEAPNVLVAEAQGGDNTSADRELSHVTGAASTEGGSDGHSTANQNGVGVKKDQYKVAYNSRSGGSNQLFSAIPQGVNTVTFEMRANDSASGGPE
jgi:hypothetical protein